MWCKLHGKTTQWEWIRVNNKSRSTESSCIFNTTTEKDLFGFCLYVFLLFNWQLTIKELHLAITAGKYILVLQILVGFYFICWTWSFDLACMTAWDTELFWFVVVLNHLFCHSWHQVSQKKTRLFFLELERVFFSCTCLSLMCCCHLLVKCQKERTGSQSVQEAHGVHILQ